MASSLGEWVEAKESAAGRGRGLFAARDIPEGQVVLVDTALACVQLTSKDEFGVGDDVSEIRACARCLRPIGPVGEQLQRVAGLDAPPALSGLGEDGARSGACAVACDTAGCGGTWCCAECRDADVELHDVVHSAAYKPVLRFAEEDNRVFDTASRCLVAALAAHARTRLPVAEVLTPLRDCVSGDWAELLDVPDDVEADEVGDFRDAMRGKIAEGHALFAAAVKASPLAGRADPAAVEEIIDRELYAHVVGALHLNSFRCDVEDDPVVGVLEAVSAAPPKHRPGLVQALLPAIHGILARAGVSDGEGEVDEAGDAGEASAGNTDLLERAIEAAPTLRGTGLYPQLRFANHSCEPNAEVRFCESATGELVATEAIPRGAEVLISYCDNDDLTVEERADELRGYGFVCDCPRCARERQG